MLNKKIYVLALSLALASLGNITVSTAQEVKIDQQAVKEINTGVGTKAAEKKTANTKPATDSVRQQLQEFLSENNLSQGIDDKGRYIGLAVAAVDVSPTQREYGKYVQLAYEKAYRQALNDFALSLCREIVSEMEDKSYVNEGSEAGQFKDKQAEGLSTWGSIYQKVAALTGAQLDKKLRELGVDPAQYSSCPPDQRQKLLEESAIKTTVKRVGETVSGVTLLHNQIQENSNGESAVGVVISTSPKVRAIADSLRFGQKPNESAVGPAFEELLPLNDEAALADNWGTRVMVGPTGPAVVAFGAWASSYRGSNNALRERYESAARSQALSNAESALSNFLSMSFTAEEANKVGSTLLNEAVKEGKTGAIHPEVVTKQIIDEMNRTMRTRSQTRLTGVRKLKDYTFEDPNGNRIVGCVLVYDFGGAAAAQNFRKPASEAEQSPIQQQNSKQPINGSVRKSTVKSNLDVF